MTIIGPDRPGLVESVASLVAEYEGNWLESRMSRLGGQFAGILSVEVPQQNHQRLIAALNSLKSKGLNVIVHPDAQEAAAQNAQAVVLELVGQDRPGIVREISHALASYGVNVEELHTECSSAAMTGETLFKAQAKLSIPGSCNATEVRRRLEQLAQDLIVDINLEEVATTESSV